MKKLSENTKLLIFLALLLGVLNFFIPPTKTEAAGLYFGGKVTSVQSCTCSSGSQVTITGPRGSSGTYLYDGGKLYRNYHVTAGKWVLGSYRSGGKCLITGDPCTNLPISKGTMTVIATS